MTTADQPEPHPFRWWILAAVLIGSVGVLLIWRLVPPDSKRATHHFDFPGAVTMTLAALTLMFNLTQGAKLGRGSTLELALWAVFAGSLVAFVPIETRASSPFVDLRLFTNRPYAAATRLLSPLNFSACSECSCYCPSF